MDSSTLSADKIQDAISLLTAHGFYVASSHDRFLSEGGEGEGEEALSSTAFYICLGGTFVCMLTAALAAGLTMGLLSLDPLELTIKERCGTDEEKRIARALLPLIKDHHLMLVTLLLYNAGANEALPLFLDKMVPSYVAIILSVTIVLFFGEIFPSAIFTGPHQLRIAYRLTPLVRFLIAVVYPVTRPIAWCLDQALGHDHGTTHFNRKELQALVEIQHEEGKKKKTQTGAEVTYDEATIIAGALAITTKTAAEVMVKKKNMWALPSNARLNEDTIADIYHQGYTRIPIYEANPMQKDDISQIIGYILMTTLVVIDPEDARRVDGLPLRTPLCVAPATTLDQLLNLFQRGAEGTRGGHLALVCRKPEVATQALKSNAGNLGHQSYTAVPKEAGLMGIITMEDVIEELLQEEIFDETDKYEKVQRKRANKVIKRWRNYIHKKRIERGEDPGTIRSFENAVDAKRRKEAKQEEDDMEDAMESGRGDEPLLNNKKSSWYN